MQASSSDFERVRGSLAETGAMVRVLSVHYGEELSNVVPESDRIRFRSAVDRGDATIVFGHHAHVAAGIERRGNGIIFYGLGNLLHAGTQNMARYDECRDFGLLAKVYLWSEPGKEPLLRAVEVIPLRDMHEITRPFPAEEAKRRVQALNALSAELGTDGGQPLFFAATEGGSGLACMKSAVRYGDELEDLCSALEDMRVSPGKTRILPVADRWAAPELTNPQKLDPVSKTAKVDCRRDFSPTTIK